MSREIAKSAIHLISDIAYSCSDVYISGTDEKRSSQEVFDQDVLPTLNNYTQTELLVLAAYLGFWNLHEPADMVVAYADDCEKPDRPAPVEWLRQVGELRAALNDGNYEPMPWNFHSSF